MTDLEKWMGGAILTAATAAFWWILNKISTTSGALHSRLDAHIKESNEKFMRRDDFKEFRQEMREQLKEISEKLDRAYKNNSPQ